MKLRTHVYALAALLIGFSACKKDEVVTPDNGATTQGNTYTAFTLDLSGQNSKTRAGNDDYNKIGDWAGNDKINTIDLYLVPTDGGDDATVEKHAFSASEFKIESVKLTVPAFKVATTGKVNIYAVVNTIDKVSTALTGKKKSEFLTAWNNSYLLEGFAKIESEKDVVLMTGKSADVTIEAGIGRDAANNKVKNFFTLDVTRVAARVIATYKNTNLSDPTMPVKIGDNKIGTLSAMKWTALQFDAKFYISQQMEGSLVKSFAWDKNAAWAAGDRNDHANFYDYGDNSKWNDLGLSKKTAAELGAKDYAPKFISETTHAADQYRKGNTAYILVKATFTPEAGICAVGVPAKDQDFWYGYDGKVYTSEQAAKDANGEKRFTKYTGGKMYYIAFINPDDVTNPTQSPILRNNFYHVDVKGFNGLGFTGDPLDPNPSSPNKPAPNDPNIPEGGKPGEILKLQKTYMAVQVSVLKWTFHSYEATLDPND